MKFYFATIIMTLFSMLILLLLIDKNRTLKKSEKTGIAVTALLIMLGAVLEFVGVILDSLSSSARTAHIIVKLTELSLAPVIPVAFADAFYPAKRKIGLFIPNFVHFILEILSAFYGFIFYVDKNNRYHHGNFYYLYYIFIFLGAVYLVYRVILFGARFQNRNGLSLAMILLFVFAGIVCHAIDHTMKIVWITVAIGMILFYIYHFNMILQVDALTELLNRKSYDSRIQTEKHRAVVLFFDINNFKSINDSFGHSFGDMCIKSVGKALKSAYGRAGLCYRIGGDEFCVIIDRRIYTADISELNSEFIRLIEKNREKDSRMPTVAMGSAVFEPKRNRLADAISEADSQMYSNKETHNF